MPVNNHTSQRSSCRSIAANVRLLGILCLTFAALPQYACAKPDSPTVTPNIVFIIGDDQGWTDYGFAGHPSIETPNLDRLARESLTFTRGYVPDSLCRPSLATILSGLYPHQHGIVGNDPPWPKSVPRSERKGHNHPEYLPVRARYIEKIDRVPTLARSLTEIGYATFQSGKWWEGHYSRGGFTDGMTHGDMTRGGRHGDEGLEIGRQGLKPITEFIDSALSKQQPFFVWYAPMLPHTPHNPPQYLLDKYLKRTESTPIAKYWAMCEWFDETCGSLLKILDDRGIRENTIVVFVTDNGWINDPGSSRYAPRSKRSPHEGGVRTPIMFNWPGQIEPKFDSTRLASSVDLVPTIRNLLRLPKSENLPGVNLLSDAEVQNRTSIYGEIFEHDIVDMEDAVASLRYRWIIQDHWKLIVPFQQNLPDEQIELYDLASDAHEHSNVAGQYPSVVDELSQSLDRWWNPSK